MRCDSLSVIEAVDKVSEMLEESLDLEEGDGVGMDLDEEAFSTSTALPRDWAHVSFVNIDSRELDLYLLVDTSSLSHAEVGMSFDTVMFDIR